MRTHGLVLLTGGLGLAVLSARAEFQPAGSPDPAPQGFSTGYETAFPEGYTAPRMSVGNGAVAIVSPTPFFRPRGFGSTSTGVRRMQSGTTGRKTAAPVVLQDGNTELMLAASTGDAGKVRQLLSQGASVNARNRHGSTALMGAAAGGYLEIVKLLLEKKADPNLKGKGGATALMFAARNGHAETVEALLKSGADPGLQDNEGKTATALASERGLAEIVETLKPSVQPSTPSMP